MANAPPTATFYVTENSGLSANEDLCPEHSHVSKPIRIARRMEVYSYVFVFRMLHRALYLASQRYNNLLCACFVSFGRWIRGCFSYLPLFLRLATQITDINGNWERVTASECLILSISFLFPGAALVMEQRKRWGPRGIFCTMEISGPSYCTA